jgi:hypothetical protein
VSYTGSWEPLVSVNITVNPVTGNDVILLVNITVNPVAGDDVILLVNITVNPVTGNDVILSVNITVVYSDIYRQNDIITCHWVYSDIY